MRLGAPSLAQCRQPVLSSSPLSLPSLLAGVAALLRLAHSSSSPHLSLSTFVLPPPTSLPLVSSPPHTPSPLAFGSWFRSWLALTPAFFSGPWITAGALFALSVAAYNFLPAPKDVVASPTLDNSTLVKEADNASVPWLTRFLAKNLAGSAERNEKYNDKHLALTADAADQKLLFNDAEQPKVRRLKYPR